MINIALFFTLGISIETLQKGGLFQREISYYNSLSKRSSIGDIYFFTYDIHSIISKFDQYNKIKIITMPIFFGYFGFVGKVTYSFLIPLIHYKTMKSILIFKSNQTLGAWSALLSSKVHNGFFIYRTGYFTSLLLKFYEKSLWVIIKKNVYQRLERYFLKKADLSFVSSNHNLIYAKSLNVNNNIFLIKNPINTNFFNINNSIIPKENFLYVGRLSKEKNLFALIDAFFNTNFKLRLIGDGPLKEALEKKIQNNPNIMLLGHINNDALKDEIERSKYFCNVSYHEGMPKALLEAMSMKRLCVCTPTKAAGELIQDGVNGFIAKGFDAANIKAALYKATEGDFDKISKLARKTVINGYSMEKASYLEEKIYQNELFSNTIKCI